MSSSCLLGCTFALSILLFPVIVLPTTSANAISENSTNSNLNDTDRPRLELIKTSSTPINNEVRDANNNQSARAANRSTVCDDLIDENRSESVQYTITIDSAPKTVNNGSSADPTGQRQRRESSEERKSGRLVAEQLGEPKAAERSAAKSKRFKTNSKKELRDVLAKPKLSERSRIFLRKIKESRRLKGGGSQSLGGKSSNLTAAASYTHEDWVDFEDSLANQSDNVVQQRESQPAPPPTPPAAGAGVPRERQAAAAVERASENGAGQVRLTKESATGEVEERPLLSKSTTTMTTIGDGKKKAKVVSKSASLPPGLRRRIIEQFVRSGGDPHNIVVSDSTITTTSQSKKKTITTVYKIVPSAQPPPSPKGVKPVVIKEAFGPEEVDLGELRGPKFMGSPASLSVGSFGKGMGGSNFGENTPKRLKGPRKIKKIMVTRTEVPHSLFMAGGNGKKGDDLGEFYQGPHETIFGLNERPEEFSLGQRKNIMSLDRKAHNSMGGGMNQKQLMEFQLMHDGGGGGAEIEKMPEAMPKVKGIGGGGISLEEIMEAMKPGAEIGPDSMKMMMLMNERPASDGPKLHELNQADLGKSYQQQQIGKHLMNFHELNSKLPKTKASETGGQRQSAGEQGGQNNRLARKPEPGGRLEGRGPEFGGERANREEANERDRPKQQRQTQEGGQAGAQSSKAGEKGRKAAEAAEKPADERERAAKRARARQAESESTPAPKSAGEGRPTKRDESGKLGGREKSASAPTGSRVSERVDPVEELKRVVLATASQRLKEPATTTTTTTTTSTTTGRPKGREAARETSSTSSARAAAGETGASSGKSAASNKRAKSDGADVGATSATPPEPAKGEKREAPKDRLPAESLQAPAAKGKTHNIMMLIDFNPVQQADQVQQQQQPQQKQRPVELGATGRAPSSGRQMLRAQSQSRGTDAFRPAHLWARESDNQWRPLRSEESGQQAAAFGAQRAAGETTPPTVSVQIYNGPVGPRQSRQPQYQPQPQPEMVSPSGVRAGGLQYAQSGPEQVLYGPRGAEQLEGPEPASVLFENAPAASQQYNLKTSVPAGLARSLGARQLPAAPFLLASGSAGGPTAAAAPPAPGGPFARPPGWTSTLAEGEEAPILPGESADTNQLVKEVIDELAMEATGGASGDGQLYTTTSVRDASADESGNANLGHGEDEDEDDDDAAAAVAAAAENEAVGRELVNSNSRGPLHSSLGAATFAFRRSEGATS